MSDNRVFDLYYELQRFGKEKVWERGRAIDAFFRAPSSKDFLDLQGNPDYRKAVQEIEESMVLYPVTTEKEIPFCTMLEERNKPGIDYKDWEYCHQYYLENSEDPGHKTPESCNSR